MPAARWKEYKKEKRKEAAAMGDGTMLVQVSHMHGVPTTELAEFAEYMDVDVAKEPYLLPIVADAMNAPLPMGWIECKDQKSGSIYYCDTETQQTMWDHPLDLHFKNLLYDERKNYKARSKTGGVLRPEGGTGATPAAAQATELYFKAQLQEKEMQLQSLQTVLDESSKHQEVLKQVDKAKEARLLREQNSKLQLELEKTRKKTQQQSKSWFGKKSTTADGAVTGSQSVKATPPPTPVRQSQLEREWLWRLREGTRDVKHDVSAIRKEVVSFKQVINDWKQSTSAQLMLAVQQVSPAGAEAAPRGVEVELATLRAQNSDLERRLIEHSAKTTTNDARDSQQDRHSKLDASEALREEVRGLNDRLSKAAAENKALEVSVRGHEQTECEVQQLLSSRLSGVTPAASLRAAVTDLLEQLAQAQREAQSGAQEAFTMEDRQAELNTQSQMSAASFEIERSALLSEIAELKGHLEGARSQVSQKQASEGESATILQGCRRDLACSQAQNDELSATVKALQDDKSDLLKEKESLQMAHEQKVAEIEGLRSQLEDSVMARETAQKDHDAATAALNGELGKAQEAKASIEGEWRQQVEKMKEREQKAATECERMFKLVQQAHEKVTSKEKDFQAKLAGERKRFETEMEQNVAARMIGVQAKYEQEARARRKYFNLVQELQGNIRVYCRVRPRLPSELSAGLEMGIAFTGEHDDLVIKNPQRGQQDKIFEFEKVLKPDLEDTEVFNAVAPLVTSVLDGYNVCIFAYGQTGSGKTYTMEGPRQSDGIYHRAMQQLFQLKADRESFVGVEISVNLLEIYNERVIDLLNSSDNGVSDNLEIRRGPQGVFVPGLTEVPVSSAEHVMEVLVHGNMQRSTAKTAMNDVSSRSHSLLVVNIVTTHPATQDREVRTRALLSARNFHSLILPSLVHRLPASVHNSRLWTWRGRNDCRNRRRRDRLVKRRSTSISRLVRWQM